MLELVICVWIFKAHHHLRFTPCVLCPVERVKGPNCYKRSRFTSRSLWMPSCSSWRTRGPLWDLPSEFKAAVLSMLSWDQWWVCSYFVFICWCFQKKKYTDFVSYCVQSGNLWVERNSRNISRRPRSRESCTSSSTLAGLPGTTM